MKGLTIIFLKDSPRSFLINKIIFILLALNFMFYEQLIKIFHHEE